MQRNKGSESQGKISKTIIVYSEIERRDKKVTSFMRVKKVIFSY